MSKGVKVGTRAKRPVEALRETRWWKPAVERHKLQAKILKQMGCEELIEPFHQYADEIMGAPEDARDGMLAVEELEPYAAIQRYPAYIEPTKAEQKLDFYSAKMGSRMR
jgi:hypothetical protein